MARVGWPNAGVKKAAYRRFLFFTLFFWRS